MPIFSCNTTLRNLTIPLVEVDQTTLQDNDLLQYNATTGRFENQQLTSDGVVVVTTASSVGTGVSIFKQKTNQDLEFRSVTAGTGINITINGDDVEIASNEAAITASNLGAGAQVFSSRVADDFQFRTVKTSASSQYLNIQQVGNEIEFTASAEINTASNLGGGEGVFDSKVGENLQFKSIVAGDNVSITSDASEITIASSAVANTGFSYSFSITFDGNGDVDTIADIPTGWTITRVGNVLTVLHNLGTYPKSISYWGKDATNGWQYRYPTGGYQATMDAGDESNEFKVDVNATAAGADASSEAKVNVIF